MKDKNENIIDFGTDFGQIVIIEVTDILEDENLILESYATVRD